MSHSIPHPTSERLQALLDGQLPAGEEARVQEHLSTCARCRSEVEAWEELFAELGSLPELAPSRGFGDRVLDALPAPAPEPLPWAARARSLLGLPTVADHVSDPRLQDYLDGGLAPRPAARVEAHLERCPACRSEAEALAPLMAGLGRLPRFSPSPGFAAGVMARVTVPERAEAGALARTRKRVESWGRALASPRGRRAWAAAAGAAVPPLVTLALVAHAVFSHPLVTVGNLLSFVWLQGSDLVGTVSRALLGGAMESPLIFEAWTLVEGLGQAPAAAAGVFLAFSALTLVAVWVLYRNLFATNPVDGRYAKLSL